MDKIFGLLSSYDFPLKTFTDVREETVKTPFGDQHVYLGNLAGHPTALIYRFGFPPHRPVPSHTMNFRSRIWAFKMLGVERIFSQDAHGSINVDLVTGDILIPHDFIDFTKHRDQSLFWDHPECWVRVDLTNPFCPQMRAALYAGAQEAVGRVVDRGVAATFEGPRFETPAEIRMFTQLGADIVGTALIPEIIYAREAEMCFGSITAIVNPGAGLAPAVVNTGKGSMADFQSSSGIQDRIENATVAAFKYLAEKRECPCVHALDQAFMGPAVPEWLKPYWQPPAA